MGEGVTSLNHLTVPVSSNDAMPEDNPLDVVAPKLDRGGVVLSGGAIDADDLGDVWSLVSGADTDFEGLSRPHGVDAALSQHAPVEEGIAGPLREFDEPKAFVGVEPLDDTLDRGTGRCLEPGLGEPGSGSESAWL